MIPDIVGIDIGTSSCSVAMMVNGQPQVLPVFEGRDEMPTYVAFADDGKRLVGWAAKRQAIINPGNTIFTVKRLIGRKFADAATQDELGLLPYRVISSFSGSLWIEAGGRSYTPTEVTAIMLAEVRRATEAYLDRDIRQAVITVPAYFDLSQIQATVEAAEIAGIEVLRTIAEPTAASLAYGFAEEQYNGLVAVYDLGGGTFDFSILELGDGVYYVRAVSGNNRLGGEDFDHLLVDFFVNRIRRDHGVDVASDALALHRIKDAAEQLKVELDSVNKARRTLPYLTTAAGGLFSAELEISRGEIEQLFEGLITRTLAPCAQAMRDADIKAADLDRLVLVGGMSRMPAVRRRISEFFGITPKRQLDPSRIVAQGAALHAGVLAGLCKNMLLLDVAPLPLGLETPAGDFVLLIDRNTTIPTKKSITIALEGGSDALLAPQALSRNGRLRVVQGGAEPIDRLLLCELQIDPNALNGEDRTFEVEFDIDANFQIMVIARDAADSRELLRETVTVGNPFGQTQQRLNESDLVATRARADELLNVVAATLHSREKVMPVGLIEQIVAARESLERAMQSRDASELARSLAALMEISKVRPTPIEAESLPAPVAVSAVPSAKGTVFVSYSRADRAWLDRLRVHLAPLERSGLIEIWHDGKIEAGALWKLEIERVLASASAAILLISANFLASEFIYANELPPILDRHSKAGIKVIPLIVGNSLFDCDAMLSGLNAFNDPKRPLSAMTAAEVEAELARLARTLWSSLQR